MLLPPIIEREMRVAMRSPGALKPRFWVAGAATLAAAFFLLLSMAYGESVWRAFHKPLFGVALYLAVIRPAQHAAGLFAEERRNQTLGLIYLTGISSFELFVTKFFGGLLLASSELLALVPFIALPFLSGGISLDLFLGTALCLPTLLIFTISLTIMISILCTDESQAFAWIGGVIVVMGLATPLIRSLGMIVVSKPPFSEAWLALSPAYAPYLVFSGFGIAGPKPFLLGIGITWFWSLLFIAIAAWLLPRHWRDDPDAGAWARFRGWYSERLRRSRNSQYLRGVLESNPFKWLVEHNRRAIAGAWLACAVVVALWLLGWIVWKQYWPSPANFYATAFLLIMLVDLFQMNAPANHIAAHRRDGIFELLLTTSLQPVEIVDGQIRGLISQFRPLRRTLCGLFVVASLAGLFTRPWTGTALASYFLIWGLLIMWALSHRRRSLPKIMWVALNSGRGAWAVMRSHGSGWMWVINLYNFRYVFRSFGSGSASFPTGTAVEVAMICTLVLIAVIIIISSTKAQDVLDIQNRLVSQMRSIVQEPVPSPRDSRFRKWNVKERFPT